MFAKRRELVVRGLRVLSLTSLAATFTLIGWWLLNTTFMIYDDEGYMLIGMNQVSQGRILYDEVFSQYGPVPFLYHLFWHHVLSLPVAHELGRLLTLGHWVIASLTAGVLAWQLSRRYWAAAAAAILAFGYLWQMCSEPSHPGGLITLLISAGLAVACAGLLRNKPTFTWVCLAGTGTLLALTKINVGLLWLAASTVFWAWQTWPAGKRDYLRSAVFVGFVAMPFVLMRPLLDEGWVLAFAGVFAATAVLILRLISTPENRAGALPGATGSLPMAMAAGSIISLAVAALTIGLGTSPQALITSVLIDPLRHAVNFSFGFRWPLSTWAVCASSLVLVVWWLAWPGARVVSGRCIAFFRIGTLLALAYYAMAWLSIEGVGHVISYCLPLAAVFAVPLVERERERHHAWVLATLAGMAQVLHAYPVAGSQMGWGTFLLVPLWIAGLAEAATVLGRMGRPRFIHGVVAATALGIAGWQLYALAYEGRQRWSSHRGLALPGGENIRPPENIRQSLRILSINAAIHADVLFSRPGMFSFNLWTGLPTPTLRNATHWFWLLRAPEQIAIVEALGAAPRSAVIISRDLDNFVRDKMGLEMTGPLNDYINRGFRRLFSVSGFDFRVPDAHPGVPFFIFENCQFIGENTFEGLSNFIEVNVAGETAIHSIVLQDILHPERNHSVFGPENCLVTAMRITSSGAALGPEKKLEWPIALSGLYRLRIYHRSTVPPKTFINQLIFMDATGNVVMEASYDFNLEAMRNGPIITKPKEQITP